MSLDRTNIAIKPREKKNAREIYLEAIYALRPLESKIFMR